MDQNQQITTALEASNKALADMRVAMERKVEDLTAKMNRKGNASGTVMDAPEGDVPRQTTSREMSPAVKAFNQYLRTGVESRELKTLTEGDGNPLDGTAAGAVPREIARNIEALVLAGSPIRQLATVVEVGTQDFHQLVNPRGWGSAWVSEVEARPATTTPTLVDITIQPKELYANPAASQRMVDDVFFNATDWISQELALTFAQAESKAFLLGSGALEPQGILTATMAATDDAARAFGTVMYIPTGLAGGFVVPTASVSPIDVLNSAIASLKPGYLNSDCAFVMHRTTFATLQNVKNLQGSPVVMQSVAAGALPTLLGYRVMISDFMPVIGAGALAILFGNFKRGYVIVDRMPLRILPDPFTNKPLIQFYATRRVGGGIVNSEAFRVIKIAAA